MDSLDKCSAVDQPKPRFQLLRYFSLANGIAALLLSAIAVAAYTKHQTSDLLTNGEQQNVGLATVMSSVVWSEFGDYLSLSGDLSRDELLARQETQKISATIKKLSIGLPVLKVKIFHPNGKTLYSSDYSQIGEDKSTNAGFLKASKQDLPASKTSFRGSFSAFSDVRANVHLIETYVPIKADTGATHTVFELYTDITTRVDEMYRDIYLAAAIAMAASGIFYGALFFVVLRADRAIASQDNALRCSLGHLEQVRAQLDSAMQNLSHGVVMFDRHGHLTLWNNQFATLHRVPPSDLRVGMEEVDLVALCKKHGSDFVLDPEMKQPVRLLEGDNTSNGSEIVRLRDGRYFAVTSRCLTDGGFIRVHEDITARRKSEARIHHMAVHDSMTGLLNRAAFLDALHGSFTKQDPGLHVGVMLVDLDGFKSVNDTLGHATGDGLLTEVARRLEANLRKSDTVARVGGDEFALIVSGIEVRCEAEEVATRILDCLSAPFDVADHTISIGASIGIALAPTDAQEPGLLLKKADAALYCAKSEGRNTFRFFAAGMDDTIVRRQRLEVDLREAIERQEFELHYQPIVRLGDERITAFEALIRWRHPKNGLVSPAEFIPVADDTGLIKKIGAWVLQQACRDAASWPSDIAVSVNLSAVQFDDENLTAIVEGALRSADLLASRLTLELTETAIIRNVSQARVVLKKLKALGISIAMDDFGTGYSSLNHLRLIEFDKIKIDRAFVSNVNSSEAAQSIIRAIVELGRTLGLPATAEGVETADELACLIKEGCAEAQGYLFSKPVDASMIPNLLEERNASINIAA